MEILYRFFDKKDQLLYVGISNNWTQRLNQHYKNSDFFSQVSYLTFTHYASRHEVEAAEKIAIETESPIYNKALNPNWETPISHFQKIKAWVYSNIQPDFKHESMVTELKALFIGDMDWDKKTAGPIAYYLLECLPNWDFHYGIDCEFCQNAWNSGFLEQYSRSFRERKHRAID